MVKLTENLTPDGKQSLDRVEAESRRMTGLVEDLLLLARLDEGREDVRTDVDLTRLVVETVSDAPGRGQGPPLADPAAGGSGHCTG